jgi:hypothetical protein
METPQAREQDLKTILWNGFFSLAREGFEDDCSSTMGAITT